MAYKQEVKEYRQKAVDVFVEHLQELEKNVIEASVEIQDSKPVSQIYVEYQESTLKLIEGKIKIDNEFLKQINITNLELYKDLEPEKFQKLQEKIVANHTRIISELKEQYEQLAVESRDKLKYKLANEREDSDLNVAMEDPEQFFPEKLNILTVNFVIIIILFAAIIGLIYYYLFV